MNARTRMSGKGQVVIPGDVRKALDLLPGQTFDVIQAGGDVILRPTGGPRTMLSFDEAMAALRAKVRYEGPVIPIEQLSWSPPDDEGDSGR